MNTTLNKIEACRPCEGGWEKLLTFLGKTKADDEPLPLLTILESNGIEDAIWALRAVEGMDGPVRLFACFCARYSLDIFESEYPDDDRPRRAIETAEKFARGQATEKELAAARAAAAGAAAWAAAKAAAGAAAWAAAKAAVGTAAQAAIFAANWTTARHAAQAAIYASAWVAGKAGTRGWDIFTEEFKRLCVLGEKYVGDNPE